MAVSRQTPILSAGQDYENQSTKHDPMFVLNMSIFNFDGSWNSIFQFPSAARKRVLLIMNTTLSRSLFADFPAYTEYEFQYPSRVSTTRDIQ